MSPTRLVADQRQRRSVATFAQAHAFVLAEVSRYQWSTAFVYGASSTALAVASARDAEVLGIAAMIVICPTG